MEMEVRSGRATRSSGSSRRLDQLSGRQGWYSHLAAMVSRVKACASDPATRPWRRAEVRVGETLAGRVDNRLIKLIAPATSQVNLGKGVGGGKMHGGDAITDMKRRSVDRPDK